MPKNPLDDWLERHATMFGFWTDQHADMLSLWCDEFLRDGYTPDELHEATRAISMNPPKYREEHLALLRDFVRQSRRKAARHASDTQRTPEARPACALCDGYGLVEVPAGGLLLINRGRIPDDSEQTITLYCRCPLGLWKFQAACECVERLAATNKEKYLGVRPLCLTAYEMAFPDWRATLADLRERRKSRRRAEDATKHHDRNLGPLTGDTAKILAKVRR